MFSYYDRVWGKDQESLRWDREFNVGIKLPEIVARQGTPYVTTESSRT